LLSLISLYSHLRGANVVPILITVKLLEVFKDDFCDSVFDERDRVCRRLYALTILRRYMLR
jgi:hypothetical protein